MTSWKAASFQDPIGFVGGDVNLYGYVQNNPINKVDPTGLYGEDVHFGLTYELAVSANIPEDVAYQIASANQKVDTSFLSNPLNPVNWLWTTGLSFHFQTQKYAGVGLSQSLDSGDINQFGKFLHIMQDTYSHNGYGFPFGHLFNGTVTDKYSCVGSSRDMAMKNTTKQWIMFFKDKYFPAR